MYAKYTTSPENRGFRASHPNIAVLQFSNKGRGEPHKTLYPLFVHSEGCAVTQPHRVRHGAKRDSSKAECV